MKTCKTRVCGALIGMAVAVGHIIIVSWKSAMKIDATTFPHSCVLFWQPMTAGFHFVAGFRIGHMTKVWQKCPSGNNLKFWKPLFGFIWFCQWEKTMMQICNWWWWLTQQKSRLKQQCCSIQLPRNNQSLWHFCLWFCQFCWTAWFFWQLQNFETWPLLPSQQKSSFQWLSPLNFDKTAFK